jgi:DNA-binding transcriptional LysR family regulator
MRYRLLMELRQLAYFVAVAEAAHFTRAAERIPVAQPAISQQIRRLEAELGERLFVRDRKGARLTEAGQAVLPHARAALAAAEGARQSVAALRGLLHGRLVLGTVQPLPDRRLPQWLGAFRRQHPGVDLALVDGETEDLLTSLWAGALDLALIGTGPFHEPPDDVEALLIAREPVVAVVPAGHRLAGRTTLTLRTLRREPIVTLTGRSRLRATLEAATRQSGFAPHIVAETTDLSLLIDLVTEGVGVAVLPASALTHAPAMAPITITQPTIERRLFLVWRRSDLSPAGRELISLVRGQSEEGSRSRVSAQTGLADGLPHDRAGRGPAHQESAR